MLRMDAAICSAYAGSLLSVRMQNSSPPMRNTISFSPDAAVMRRICSKIAKSPAFLEMSLMRIICLMSQRTKKQSVLSWNKSYNSPRSICRFCMISSSPFVGGTINLGNNSVYFVLRNAEGLQFQICSNARAKDSCVLYPYSIAMSRMERCGCMESCFAASIILLRTMYSWTEMWYTLRNSFSSADFEQKQALAISSVFMSSRRCISMYSRTVTNSSICCIVYPPVIAAVFTIS